MKTLKVISIVLILSFASCRSRQMSFDRSKTSEIGKEKFSLKESHSELVNGVRVVEIRDSSKQFVGLRIYPLDTFSLSVNDGFRGLASVVEYWGVKESVNEGRDSSGGIAMKEYMSGYVGESEMRKDQVLKNREVRKESIAWVGWIVIVGLGLIAVGVWKGNKFSL